MRSKGLALALIAVAAGIAAWWWSAGSVPQGGREPLATELDRAEAAMASGDYARARTHFEAAAAAAPEGEWPGLTARLGAARAECRVAEQHAGDPGLPDAAVARFDALLSDPSTPSDRLAELHQARAFCLVHLGRHEAAKASFLIAQRIGPRRHPVELAWIRLGLCDADSGRGETRRAAACLAHLWREPALPAVIRDELPSRLREVYTTLGRPAEAETLLAEPPAVASD